VINLDRLQELADAKELTVIDTEVMIKAGLMAPKHLLKILGNGSLTAKLEVKAHAFSKSAEEAITNAGGTAIKIQ
jgi:large subunit ribosomal protein L15